MRYFCILCFSIFTMIFPWYDIHAVLEEEQSVIIEVEGDPLKHKEYIEKYYPSIDVVAVYEILFNGLALQATPKNLAKISAQSFVQATYPTKMYEQISHALAEKMPEDTIIPATLHTTQFTGKGIKVGVIDTGIDYTHPDLTANYAGGYDVVDFDDDPMETTTNQGIPTLHGTHVAGIIAADGKLIGVARDAEIYAYRALGPGGSGSSIQVIAAMEKALKDGVDIMNLSLGNIVNGPDFPTSIAVNRAAELGVAVVIANGNNGPNDWTVGAPATASGAISVGALAYPENIPYLYERQTGKEIMINRMQGSLPWEFTKDYPIVHMEADDVSLFGKIALIKRGSVSFYDKAKQAEKAGALAAIIYNNEAGNFQGAIDNQEDQLKIPVISIAKEDGNWIKSQIRIKPLYIDTIYKETKKDVAPFSSRGPVTMNWALKPDILAPGTNILSTVPGGYQELQGTSMASPYVAGAIALMKEAQPTWSNQQIIGALKTTATQIKQETGELVEPTSQGMGEIQVEDAMKAETIINNTLLSFGRVNTYKETKVIKVTIENMADEDKHYVFDMPKQQQGIQWKLPQTFTVAGKQSKEIPIELSVNSQLLAEGSHQGWLNVREGRANFNLPYLFINQTADFPKMMGFGFTLKPFSADVYTYDLYITEEAKQVEVHLYHPETMMYIRRLLLLTDVKTGTNEGEIKKADVGHSGHYLAIITVQMQDGTYESYQEELVIE